MPRASKPRAAPLRVAMVATKVPSEPLAMLQATLGAMLAQEASGVESHDVWLADESPDAETLAWCAAAGVRVSCRKGVAGYHERHWPRRARCKEGNLAYFYDTVGYANYDVVCQFDADHVADAKYLATLLPAFNDPRVGYAACPSICGANASSHWTVRGRLHLEAFMHGPLGAARSFSTFPCCIGSHYAVRTAALRDIGGVGPELDEDLSTSLYMTASAWKGEFVIDALAVGDGPATFEDAMRQDYQWSRSAVVILVRYLAHVWVLPFLTLRERFAAVLFFLHWPRRVLFLLPLVVLTLAPWLPTTNIAGGALLASLWAAPYCVETAHTAFLRACGVLRPADTPIVSWEMLLHKFAIPYWIAIGCAHGLVGGLLSAHFDIKVTPKGPNGLRLLTLSHIAPFIVVATSTGASSVWLAETPVGIVVVGSAFNAIAAVVIAALHWREHYASVPRSDLPWAAIARVGAALVVAVLFAAAATSRFLRAATV